ncbi:SIMPL domain-containing protein [Rhizobium tumorigenes]|uniref:SIMPL domain-containing protein n=1 Tax=Rhizobium tumorigenes TaxID=2041385 RepID=UPI00241E1DE8|nr:SIMPL domain-containing protein [Rhizobium tumorigenes]WFR99591.1 SIMPL domain-containing protein [Rhizobium tumorigenes]
MTQPQPARLACSALAGLALLTLTSATAFAAGELRQALISVSGEGQAAVAPDMAVVTLSVVKQSKTAQDALDQDNKAMGAVLATLKNGGIAERDLQTSGFAIQPQYNYPPAKDGQQQQPELVGYQVTNGLTVRVRDLGKLGGLIDQAVGLGINQGGDIQFVNDKPDEAIEAARKDAMANAAAKAKTLAEAAGVKVGRVIEITENAVRAAPQPMMRPVMLKAASDTAVPVAGGENSYNVTVNVTYALEP